jgi:hypothetical protein
VDRVTLTAESIRYLRGRTIESSTGRNDLGRFRGMSARMWAAIGNLLRIGALWSFLASAVMAYLAVDPSQAPAPTVPVLVFAVLAVVNFVIGMLGWMAKGPLVSGNSVVRLLVGLYMLLAIVGTLGLILPIILIVYLFTSEPETYTGMWARRTPAKPRFTAPRDWGANGRVGPSGAMLYSDTDQRASVGIFESGIAVQVVGRQDGWAEVVASSGERGWIDVRTLTEGV